MAIIIQIEREDVGVLMTAAEWPSVLVFAGQLGTVDSMSVTRLSHQCRVQELTLW